jgi:hypothetical protein
MLQSQLSRAEDKSLSDFPLNSYITRLIEILGHTVMMDFQIDTKCKYSYSLRTPTLQGVSPAD